jgi:hypothetical protein
MSKELGLLNFICILAALGFLALIVVSALASGDFISTDNLFIITVCLVMALVFAFNPILYLKSQGKLPIPFMKKSASPLSSGTNAAGLPANTPPLLDAKGRAVPPDVKAIVARFGQAEVKDA